MYDFCMRVFNLSTTDIWDQMAMTVGTVLFRMLNSIPHELSMIYLPSTSQESQKSVQTLQTSPTEENHPQLGTTTLENCG